MSSCRLPDHFVSSGLLNNPYHSAYCKRHSTETALYCISMDGHLINAVGSQKLSCLCLLDLSAAFNTIDHIIVITCLSSRFGLSLYMYLTGLRLSATNCDEIRHRAQREFPKMSQNVRVYSQFSGVCKESPLCRESFENVQKIWATRCVSK